MQRWSNPVGPSAPGSGVPAPWSTRRNRLLPSVMIVNFAGPASQAPADVAGPRESDMFLCECRRHSWQVHGQQGRLLPGEGLAGGRQGPVGVSEAQAAELNVLNPTLFCEVALQHQQLFEPRRDHHGLARLLTGFRNVSQLAKRSVQIPLAWLMPRARCPPGSDGPWQALPNSGR